MLHLVFIIAQMCSFYCIFKEARNRFKTARDVAEEILISEDPLSSVSPNHFEFIECKNFKSEAYLRLAENYYYSKDYNSAVKAFKRLMQLAWKSNDKEMEMRAFQGLSL